MTPLDADKTVKFSSTNATVKVDRYRTAAKGWLVGELHLPVLHSLASTKSIRFSARAIANLMDAPRLNLFPSDERQPHREATASKRRERELDQVTGLSKPRTMMMPLGVIVPLLMRAAEHNHTWLEDFADDTVQIDIDLHQVLMAFQDLPHRRAA
ncbi:MAG: hypothetical protein WBD20_18620 [Pirellulaceae bacterium]